MAYLYFNWKIIGLWHTILVLSISIVKGNNDYYTSTFGVQKLVKVEQKLLNAAFDYLNALESRLTKVKRYLNDYEESIVSGMRIPGQKLVSQDQSSYNEDSNLRVYPSKEELDELSIEVSSHPLMTYRLIRRFALELQEIVEDMSTNIEKKFLTQIERLRKGVRFPKSEDIAGAIEGIIRIQDAYDLNVTEFSAGKLLGLQTNARLRAVDCYHIGVYALKASIFTRAIEWLEQSFFIVSEGNDTSIKLDIVENALRQAIYMHNEMQKNDPANVYVFKTQFSFVNSSDQAKERQKLNRTLEDIGHELYRETETMMDMWNFAALCAGKVLQTRNTSRILTCYYQPWPSVPIYLEKVELLHKDPPVYQIYDILSDSMIDTILEQSAPFMSRSKVLTNSGKGLSVQSSIRTSTTHWIQESSSHVLKHLSFRIEQITGLTLNGPQAAENLQISSYGIGGHYNPHFDTVFEKQTSVSPFERMKGDRIATFMLYLSTVHHGGATAFPRLGIVAQPVKGSALFWYNLKRNGSHQPLSLHGGCPVIFGTKHVANKWIRSNAQSFHHRCSLDRYAN